MCLLSAGCTTNLPLDHTPNDENTAVGVGGLLTLGGNGTIRISIEAAPWTLATATFLNQTGKGNLVTLSRAGFAHVAASATNSSIATDSGVIQLVAPRSITTSGVVGNSTRLSSFLTLTLPFIPEPGPFLLLASSVVDLGLIGRSRTERWSQARTDVRLWGSNLTGMLRRAAAPLCASGDPSRVMVDYREGIKREVAEVKFLIHDLRVEQFINDIIHFHVTLNTDLEIHSADEAQVLHGQDVQVLKAKAVELRRAFREYSDSVTNFSPDQTILLSGRKYIDAIYSTCQLILDPLWGRIDKVISFLPSQSLSVQARSHYRNCLQWIGGVRNRIEQFLEEQGKEPTAQEFDIGDEIRDFTTNVILGYVTEKGRAKVELQLGRLDSAVIRGNLPRFRRMYFNLVMNAVDAMRGRKVGILNISDVVEGERVVLRVIDNGSGMTPEKKQELLTDKETLDGELRSLGFVFVRQTIAEYGAKLAIESEPGKTTTIAVSFPFLAGRTMTSTPSSSQDEYGLLSGGGRSRQRGEAVVSGPSSEAETLVVDSSDSAAAAAEADAVLADGDSGDRLSSCGRILYEDYEVSEAEFPGSVFFLGVSEDDGVDFFSHKPYERGWNITHEDLAPMLFQSAVRGRLEEGDDGRPVVILKPPIDPGEYFDSRNVPQADRSPAAFVEMVHDEYIRVARKLIATGLSGELGLHLADVRRFFPGQDELVELEPFPLERLAAQRPIRS